MEKRLALALLLTFLIFIGWGWFSHLMGWRKSEPPPPPPATAEIVPSSPSDAPAEALEAPDGAVTASSREETLTLTVGSPGEVGSYLATFSNKGARLTELRIGDFQVSNDLDAAAKLDPSNWTTLIASARSRGVETGSLVLRTLPSSANLERAPLDVALWEMRKLEDGRGVEFELAPGSGVRFKKRVLFTSGSYQIRVELELVNESGGAARDVEFRFTPAEAVPLESGDQYYVEPNAVAAAREPGTRPTDLPEFESEAPETSGSETSGSFRLPTPIAFAGVHNKYFAVLMRGADELSSPTITSAAWRRLRDDAWAARNPATAHEAWRLISTDVGLTVRVPDPGKSTTWAYTVFAGPKDRDTLLAELPAHEVLIEHDLGYFNGIAGFLLRVMRFFHDLVGNWGVAIILLTFSVRLILFPINRRSQIAMARYSKKMKRVQPQIEELKKRFASDPAKLRQEQAALMQKERLFPPLGGCLPIFVQIPVFFGLFSALRVSFDLRQAPFVGWMTDLSQPDRFLDFGVDRVWPLLGSVRYLNLLPPLMVILWVAQQMLAPKPSDEQQARIQKMLLFMPVVMGLFLYNYAAGLSLYMITQSALGILEMTLIKKLWPIDDNEVEPKKSGCMSLIARLHEEQQRRLQGGSAAKRKDDGPKTKSERSRRL